MLISSHDMCIMHTYCIYNTILYVNILYIVSLHHPSADIPHYCFSICAGAFENEFTRVSYSEFYNENVHQRRTLFSFICFYTNWLCFLSFSVSIECCIYCLSSIGKMYGINKLDIYNNNQMYIGSSLFSTHLSGCTLHKCTKYANCREQIVHSVQLFS